MSDFNPAHIELLQAIEHLVTIVAQLRHPQTGCPWDIAQTPQTLIPYVIEEAYEVVDAIKSEDKEAIAEELGDLLLQVVLQAQIASETEDFDLEKVAKGISNKLIRRHPHVFGDLEVKDITQVRKNWDMIKAEEKRETSKEQQLLSRQLQRYARSLPPLIAGMKISKKAATAGFEWDNITGVWAKFSEELSEFKEALQTEDKIQQQAELGDLLFTIINIARWYDLDPFQGLQETNLRFIQRLSLMEKFAERPLSEYSLEELERLWQKAKVRLNQ
ncbi:MAG: nucleoside triphosphate pyrophosphohydrolase [Cyanobacteria bacterium J083]|nr:MAG: nucleoside triphosphate pyrophosphohydrolase [Cyanobacteria bacterium J083]